MPLCRTVLNASPTSQQVSLSPFCHFLFLYCIVSSRAYLSGLFIFRHESHRPSCAGCPDCHITNKQENPGPSWWPPRSCPERALRKEPPALGRAAGLKPPAVGLRAPHGPVGRGVQTAWAGLGPLPKAALLGTSDTAAAAPPAWKQQARAHNSSFLQRGRGSAVPLGLRRAGCGGPRPGFVLPPPAQSSALCVRPEPSSLPPPQGHPARGMAAAAFHWDLGPVCLPGRARVAPLPSLCSSYHWFAATGPGEGLHGGHSCDLLLPLTPLSLNSSLLSGAKERLRSASVCAGARG